LGAIEAVVEVPVGGQVRAVVLGPLRLEALSPPPGGRVSFSEAGHQLVLELASDGPSTMRAMYNSYMGLVSAALRTASREGTS
jgi:tRNA threonylcarbamoyladenosine modification (KEOPS) complex  Pcc1 subunit